LDGRTAKAKRVEARIKPSREMEREEASARQRLQMERQSATGTTTRKRSAAPKSVILNMCATGALESILSTIASLVDQRQIPLQID
jgi:hypothetical protein